MEIQIEPQGQVTRIVLAGSLDATTSDSVTDALLGQINEGNVNLVVDMSGVDFVSSVGLRVFLTVLREIRQKSGDLRMAAIQPGVSRMLTMSGFTSVMKSFDTAEAAVKSFEG